LARGGGRGACPQRVRSRFTLARCGLPASSGSVHLVLLGLRMPATRALGRNAPEPPRQAARVSPLLTQSSSSASLKFHNRRMRGLKWFLQAHGEHTRCRDQINHEPERTLKHQTAQRIVDALRALKAAAAGTKASALTGAGEQRAPAPSRAQAAV